MTLRYPRPRVLEKICQGKKPPRHAVIEASAGTGKTYTLEHSVIELLLAEVPAEKLLIVTFTERATYELRERVRRLLANIVNGKLPEGAETATHFWEIGDAERAILERALLAFDQAPIHTIHGFCHRVLTENAFLAGRLFEQELVDSKGAFSSGFMHVLKHELANDPNRAVDLRAWLREHSVAELEELLQEIDEKRAEVRPLLDRKGLLEDFASLREGVDKRLDAAKAAVADSDLHGGTKTAVLARMDALREFVKEPEATGSVVGLHVSENRSYIFDWLLAPERVEKLRAVKGLKSFMGRLAAINEKLVTVEAAVAQVFLPSVQARVQREKATKGHFDFSDMLTLVRDAVTTGPQRQLLLARIRERYAHALIDEFQDTDEVQWAIFDEVFVKSPDDHGLWVIGDPKQSIYGFRGADVFAYIRARDALLRGGEAVPLEENFRSTDALIKAYNTIFDQKAEPPFFRQKIRYDAPVVAGRKSLVAVDASKKPVTPIHVFDLQGERLNADGIRSALARRIAEEIDRLLREGLWLEDGESSHRIGPSDIYILTRSGKEGAFVSRFLAEKRIPFAFYKQDGLFQTDEADDIYRVLAAIDDPGDRSKRSKAWLTPFFDQDLATLSAGDPPSDHVLFKRLFQWERLAERGDFRGLFASMVEETGLLRREIFASTSERRLTNYLHILELLLETVSKKRLGLRELAHLLRAWIREEQELEGEGNVQRLESDAKAVQIMSLHKSKGLEAAVVFLFGGYTDAFAQDLHVYHEREDEKDTDRDKKKTAAEIAKEKRGTVFFHDESGKRLVHVGPLTREVRDLVLGERDEENRRLLYVGITRAKAKLYLAGFGKVDDDWNFGYLNGPYRCVAERLHALIHEQAPPAGFEVEKVRGADDRSAPQAPPAPAAAPWTPPAELLEISDLRAIEESCARLRVHSAAQVLTSYTRMKKGFTPTAAEIEADTLQEEGPSPALPHFVGEGEGLEMPPGGSNTGQFFHDVLEHLAFESFAEAPTFEAWREREDVKELFTRCMGWRGIAERYRGGCERIVHRTLTKKLDLGGVKLDLAAGTKNLRELEFAYPIPGAGDRGWIRGFIDFIFEHEGRTYLLDWKTDTLDSYDAKSVAEHVRSSYWIQVQVYTLALARMLAPRDAADHEKRFGGVLYCFLRGMRPEQDPGIGVYFLRPDLDGLRTFERELIAFEYR